MWLTWFGVQALSVHALGEHALSVHALGVHTLSGCEIPRDPRLSKSRP